MKYRGFTLLELLTVIAIVAVLSAILYPVFARAREQSRQVACLTNEKQIGAGILQYTRDYDGNLPPANLGLGGWAIEIRWYDMVAPYISRNKGIVAPNGHQYGAGGVWQCPSITQPQSGVYGVHEFAFPGAIGGNGEITGPVVNTSAIQHTSQFIMVLEKGLNDGNSSWPFFTAAETHWTDTVGNPPGSVHGADYSVDPGGPDSLPHNCDLAYTTSSPFWNNYGGCGTMPRYRHNASVGAIFLDGHVKAMPAHGIDWYTNIYDANVYAGNPTSGGPLF